MSMHDTPKYSPHLHCIYDESAPTNHFGRGTHYSIFQALSWRSKKGKLNQQATVHNVAVIWDEDHDERIIPCMEALLMNGLLYAVSIIGERKGHMNIVFNSMSSAYMDTNQKHIYRKEITKIVNDIIGTKFEDSWSITFGEMSDVPSMAKNGYKIFHQSLIYSDIDIIDAYIRKINNRWNIDA